MSIAFDVTAEMARRIATEARDSDKLSVIVYAFTAEFSTFGPFLQAWRYLSSPDKQVFVQDGSREKFLDPFPVRSRDAMISIIYPPGCSYVSVELLYIVLSGNHTVPMRFKWPNATPLDTVLDEHFPKRVKSVFLNTEDYADDAEEDDEGAGINTFLKEELGDFIWNILK